MNICIKTLSQQVELAMVVLQNVFMVDEAVYGAGQMDLFQDDIDKLRINDVSTRLYKMTKDANFVEGFATFLETMLIQAMESGADNVDDY